MSGHPWWRWECFENGFYDPIASSKKQKDIDEQKYMQFFTEKGLFSEVLPIVSFEWPFSFEHFLTNDGTNKIAWLGQVSVCYKYGISSFYKSAYNKLDIDVKRYNNQIAKNFYNRWIDEYDKGKSGSLYFKLDEKRIRKRDTARGSTGLDERKFSTILQGDMFSYFEK